MGSLEGVPVYGGLDLSCTTDLTALVLIGWRDGKWRVQPTFWLPSEGLSDKATADQRAVRPWHGQGYLQATPGKTVHMNLSPSICARYSIATTFRNSRSTGGIFGT